MKNKILMSFLLFIFMIFYAVPSFGASFYVKPGGTGNTIQYYLNPTGGGTTRQVGIIKLVLQAA